MVASLLAVGASPAAAAEIKTGEANQASPSHTTKMTACLGAAEDDAGFTDVSEMHAFYGAINCLAHYGITEGKGDGTYDPEATVSSFEMELFMSRAAKLVGADAEDVVGDVMMSDPVTRAEMAVLIANLLVESAHNDVEIGSDGLISIDDNLARTFDHYADARGSQPRSVDASISALYELGVVKGTGDGTTFSPSDDVDRGEMAAIITRALAHTNARPAGLTAQADGATIVVSVRADNHDPEVNVLVDAFWVSSERADRAIDDDGECRPLVKPVDSDSDECEIDDDSTGTNNDGQARIYGLPDDLDEEVTVWVWQGEEGDEVDADTELFPLTVGPLTPPVEHEAIKVTEMSPRVPLVKFGQTYNLSAQLQATVDGEDVDVAPVPVFRGWNPGVRRGSRQGTSCRGKDYRLSEDPSRAGPGCADYGAPPAIHRTRGAQGSQSTLQHLLQGASLRGSILCRPPKTAPSSRNLRAIQLADRG